MKENVSHDAALYEQIALDYFLQHIFLERDYFYDMVYYKPVINPGQFHFRRSDFDGGLSEEAYKTDRSVGIPDLSGKRLLAVAPSDVEIAEHYEGIVDNTYYLYLEVYTRIPLMNGHCIVGIELNGYRFFNSFFIEIAREDGKVVKWFFREMSF
ncbi:hypothetical protein [Chitinophaga sp. CF418]|uniref:hypothetical protein n=1 Tax=Chitinophaga sp. CF418 TaxID=1855287 RepID=UPI00091EA780|nr:hypothetical protein [Chitinophaga sp. CF418]SHN39157.1 hypothetical protein SAMN05216311_111127 [Chitinophaga sp. CF418]